MRDPQTITGDGCPFRVPDSSTSARSSEVLGLREPGATSSSKFCGLVFNAAAVDCNGQEAPTRKLSDPLEVQTP